MRKQIAIFLLLIAGHNLFGSNIISLPYLTNDIVYSEKHDKLYALIDVMDTEYGNRLVEINTSTGEIERSLFVGSQPWRIRLTTDENYAWLSFSAIPFMKRIDLNSFAIDKKVFLGPSQKHASINNRNSQILCYNFTVFPNENNKLAIGIKSTSTFAYEGIVLYSNDTIQPKRILPYVHTFNFPVSIEPVLDNTYIIGHSQTSISSTFTTMKVVNDGLEMQDEFEGLIEVNGPLRRNWIKVHNDTLYVAEGIIIDATDISDLEVIGKCENDVIGDLYGFTFSEIHDAYIYPNFHNDSVFLTSYDNQSFEAYNSVFLMEYQFYQVMMITQLEVINTNRFAIVIGKDYGTFSVRIIDTQETGVEEEITNREFEIYPNPIRDKLYVNGLPKHKIICIYDITGRSINTWETHEITAEIKLNKLTQGIYFLKIIDPVNNSTDFVKKIIIQ